MGRINWVRPRTLPEAHDEAIGERLRRDGGRAARRTDGLLLLPSTDVESREDLGS